MWRQVLEGTDAALPKQQHAITPEETKLLTRNRSTSSRVFAIVLKAAQ